jgi:hypothetical protein
MRQLALLLILVNLYGCNRKGCIDGNCKDGYGTYLYSNGGIGKGIWVNAKMNGYGFQKQGKGDFENDTYEGYFVNGEYDGKGTYFFSKFDAKLLGEFKKGKPNGACTVFFGTNSSWKGTYTGVWINGYNEDFEQYLKTTKNGEQFISSAASFFDTIIYYYRYPKVNDFIKLVNSKYERDLTKEKVSFIEVVTIMDSLHNMQYNLNYSLEMIKSLKEFDTKIPLKKITYDYLNTIKVGFEKDFSNWVLLIQHNPDEDKPWMIYDYVKPFVDSVKAKGITWTQAQIDFLDRYKLR